MPVRLYSQKLSLLVVECEIDICDEPVVVFVGHTLLLCGISLDIDDVSYAVVDEVGRQFDGAMICEI